MAISKGKFRVIQDPVYKYARLDPLPGGADTSEFYQGQYYDLVKKGGRAPELRRFMAGGQEAEGERAWLRATLYPDICTVLDEYAPGRRVLDVGCGPGEFLAYLKANGFDAMGMEPSDEAVASAKSRGLTVHNCTLEEFVTYAPAKAGFDSVTLLNVLEHLPDPVSAIEKAKRILNRDGIICIRVPNDFTEIQSAAQKELGKEPWWIAVPDHVNYFDTYSLPALLEKLGFDVVYLQTDFPMELFLLMGEDYIGNPEVGGKCHQKRVRFEMAVPGELRRRLYRSLAAAGIGRDMVVFGRARKI